MTNVSLEFQNVHHKIEQGLTEPFDCSKNVFLCTPDTPIDIVELSNGQKEDDIVTIKSCIPEEVILTAELVVEIYNVENKQSSNLEIGETDNLTKISVGHLENLYLSTKHVQTNDDNRFEEIIVYIYQKPKGIIWMLSLSLSSFIAPLLILTSNKKCSLKIVKM